MRTKNHPFLGVIVLATVAVSFCACGGPQKKKEGMTLEEYEENTPPTQEADPCRDEKGESKQCETDADCCQGFVCTNDPDRSQVFKYCIET